MTQTRDLIKKIADFFTSEEFYEKGEDARLELSPDDVRCMNDLIQQRNKDKVDAVASVLDKIRADIERLHYHPKLDFIKNDEVVEMALEVIDKYR